MRKLSGLPFTLLVTWCLNAQNVTISLTDISFYADVMVHASKPVHRMRAATEFLRLFKDYLNTPESSANTFKDLPWLTVVTPQDSTFRIITWQVEEDLQTFRYYGYIQFLSRIDHPPLEFRDTRSLTSEYASFDQGTWYGAIYYGIQPFKTQDKTDAYLLLGFNAHTPTINQRVAEVLILQSSGATFGSPVFNPTDSTEVKSRIILEYTDVASATMRFDREKELLIYDHVIPITTPEGPALVPDGSYHGYRYTNGMWHFIDSVFNIIMDEPPGGREPQKEKRDLFGREMKKKD